MLIEVFGRICIPISISIFPITKFLCKTDLIRSYSSVYSLDKKRIFIYPMTKINHITAAKSINDQQEKCKRDKKKIKNYMYNFVLKNSVVLRK